MKNTKNSFLLILWFATIGIDRINFLGEGSSFKATPFLLLSLFICLKYFHEVISVIKDARVRKRFYFLIRFISAFLFMTGLSIFMANDIPLSLKRYILLSYNVIFTVLILKIIYNREDGINLLVTGAKLGLLFNIIFSVFQLSSFFIFSYDFLSAYTGGIVSASMKAWGGFGLRLSGVSDDPNRGALVMSIYLFIILNFQKNKRLLYVVIALLLIAATLSRTGFLFLAFVILASILNGNLKAKHLALISMIIGTLAYILIVSVIPNAVQGFDFDLIKTLEERFSSDSGSSNVHYELLERGIEIIFSDLKVLLIGIGYGCSYTVLMDIFGVSKDGNFHSLFLSFGVETGILTVIILAFFFIVPIFISKYYRIVVIALIGFNIFYQTNAEPIFWFFLFLAWFNIMPDKSRPDIYKNKITAELPV